MNQIYTPRRLCENGHLHFEVNKKYKGSIGVFWIRLREWSVLHQWHCSIHSCEQRFILTFWKSPVFKVDHKTTLGKLDSGGGGKPHNFLKKTTTQFLHPFPFC